MISEISEELATNPESAIRNPQSTELLSAFALSEVLQIDVRGVRKRLKDAPRSSDETGLIAWRWDVLPDDWKHRLNLAKQIKGCDTVSELLTCRQLAIRHFEHSIEQATDHEKKLWPHRKSAILEYYRVLECSGSKDESRKRACALYERLSAFPVSTRNMQRWIKPVEKCGGPQHAPDEAYVLWGKRRTLDGPPRKTIEYFHLLVTQNQRKFAPAYKKLLRQLIAWQETGSNEYRIPGYASPPPNAKGSDLPKRWSYAYFKDKKRRPTKPVVEGARYGVSAIKSLAAMVRKTRLGLKVHEIVYMDDQVYDVKVNVLGINTKATKPLGLDAHDRASDCTFSSFFKPTVWDDAERARRMLRLYDMIWFVVHFLTRCGFRTDEVGTTLYVEKGTAAIPQWLRDTITLVTDGKVKVLDSAISNDPAFPGQFEGQGHGCSNFKAAIEGARNPLRNVMADTSVFPGAVGKDRDHSPEELHGRDRYNNLLLKAAAKIGKDAYDLFEFPYMEWRDFGPLATEHIELVNTEPDHNCEAWAECGYTAQEWRLDDNAPWQSREAYGQLSDVQRLAIGTYLDANPSSVQTRKLTRREVYNAGKRELTTLPLWAVPQLLTHPAAPEGLSKMRRVNGDGQFRFDDIEADPYGGEFLFLARVHDRAGHTIRLTEGEKYKTFLNPIDPSALLVCQPNGAWLGECHAIDPAAANDADAAGKLIGTHRSLVNEAKTDLARLGEERTRELAKMRMRNEGVAAKPKTARSMQIATATPDVASEIYSNA